MTNNCIIGPIKIPAAHLEDNNTFNNGTEEFTLLTTHQEALQLQGLTSKTQRGDYGNTSVISTQKSGWGLVPLDTSVELYDNEDWTHRGYYLINTVEPTPQQGMYMQSKVSAEKVANTDAYLNMNYTPGYNDGTTLEFNYPPTEEVITTLLDDTFGVNSYETGPYNWTWGDTYNIGTGTITIATTPSKLAMSGYYLSDAVPGYVGFNSKNRYSPPWTAEFDLSWPATPALDMWSRFGVSLFADVPHPMSDVVSERSDTYMLRFYVHTNTGGNTYANAYNLTAGNKSYLWPSDNACLLTSSQKSPKFKVQFLPGGVMTIWLAKDGGATPTWTKMWGPASVPGKDWRNPGFYIYLETFSRTNLSFTMDEFKVYKTSLGYSSNNNIIPLPAGTDVELETAADFTRASEDGDIPLYLNPTEDLYFRANEDSFYYGSVKAYSNNYSDDVYRQITRPDEVINFYTLPCMYVKNGLIKLEPTDIGVKFYYWDDDTKTYVWLKTYDVGTIKTMKMVYISPERCTFKINDTLWTVNRGKPFIKVEHPTTDVTYNVSSYYVHDGVTATTPQTDVDITMGTYHYTNIYNDTSDTYRSQIYQLNPTTITTTTIPAADVTGIGVYNNTELSTSYNHPSKLAQEFLVQPHTNIGVKY